MMLSLPCSNGSIVSMLIIDIFGPILTSKPQLQSLAVVPCESLTRDLVVAQILSVSDTCPSQPGMIQVGSLNSWSWCQSEMK